MGDTKRMKAIIVRFCEQNYLHFKHLADRENRTIAEWLREYVLQQLRTQEGSPSPAPVLHRLVLEEVLALRYLLAKSLHDTGFIKREQWSSSLLRRTRSSALRP
jgi:hypothetical protein